MAQSRVSRALQIIAVTAAMMACAPAFAQWTGKGQVGIALSTGNGDSVNANMKVNARHTAGSWEKNFGFTGVYESDDDVTTSQLWEIESDARYTFNARDFGFGGFRYQNDRFSGFRYQGTVSGGLGRRFIDSDRTKLVARAGLGYKFSETRDATDPGTGLLVPGREDNSVAAVGGFDWEYKWTDTTTFHNNFFMEWASQNTFLRNEIGVTVAMTSRLALAAAYSIRHNTDPPISYDTTETLLTMNLVYEVK
jgi:putative salt-induced outer membrane protein